MSMDGNTLGNAIRTAVLAELDSSALGTEIKDALLSSDFIKSNAEGEDEAWVVSLQGAVMGAIVPHLFSTDAMQAMGNAIVDHITNNASVDSGIDVSVTHGGDRLGETTEAGSIS